MNIKDFTPKKFNTFLLIKESKNGIETYFDETMTKFNKPLKAQVKAFLDGVIKEL